ncbi:MAG: histidinol-phosphatase [Oscillospiraceae bacterium]|nr:histidinol-phosphatase [Oscillospiraceae bacterium]
MLYRYEPHMHTFEASGCGRSTGAEMAEMHKAKGYDGIIVTDHFFNGNSAVPYDLPWEEKIDLFCKGYENAKARGDEIGLKVFFGWEFTYAGADFLTYGLDKTWLKKHPEIMDMKIYDYCDFVAECGGFIVHAHPFRQYNYIKKITLIPDNVGAVEIINSSHFDEKMNDRAKWYAESFNLPVTAGSDSHDAKNLLGGGISVEKPLETIFDYIEAVKKRSIAKLHNKDFINK